MADPNTPTSRAQRRAVARDNKSHLNGKLKDIKMEQPDRSGPKGKTLFDLAAERQLELDKGKPFPKQSTEEHDDSVLGEPFGPAGEAILYSFSLSMVHLMLDVLVNNQYRQEIVWSDIWTRFGTALPTFFMAVYLFHTPTAARFGILRQLIFLVTAVAAGCYMIHSGNTKGFYAIMKRAPPTGTLWIWCVVELDLLYAVASVAAVVGYLLYNGYRPF